MTIHETERLLREIKATQHQLLNCLENLCKEYGYIQGMTVANFRDANCEKETFAEIQNLIEQLKQKIKSLKCTS